MKSSKKLLILATSALLLASCGGGSEKGSSNPIDSSNPTSSETTNSSESSVVSSSVSSAQSSAGESSTSTSRRPIGGNSSSTNASSQKPSSTSEKSSSTSQQVGSDSDDLPVLHKIFLHADSVNEGLTVTAPAGSYADKQVELTVNLSEGYIIEYIRLYAPTASEGGVRVNPNADGKYVFTMPNKNVDIYYKGVKGYKVNFIKGEHAEAELAEDSAEFDLFGAGYPVYVCKKSVEAGYAFVGFEVKDENGAKIDTWNDAEDQVGFLMPAGNVTVKPLAEAIDPSLASIAGTYTRGVAIDMNAIDDAPFELVIGMDKKVKFVSDWLNPDWTGTYTYENNVLEADVTNLSQDGYYTSTTRHLKVTFLENNKYLATELSSSTGTYHYMLGKTSEGLMAKKLYMSKLENGDYTRAHRLVSFSAMSGDFFTYVNPTRTSACYYLNAFEKGTENQAYSLIAGKTYTMKTKDGAAFIEVKYDGTNIEVKDPSEDVGPGGEGEQGGEQTEKVTPFAQATYKSTQMLLTEDYGERSAHYVFRITFGSTLGSISEVSLKAVGDVWYPPIQDQEQKSGLSYVYDAETGAITVTGLGSKPTIMSYQENGSILYRGKVWRSDWAEEAYNNNDVVLTVE